MENSSYLNLTTFTHPTTRVKFTNIPTLEWIGYILIMVLAVLSNMLIITALMMSKRLRGLSHYHFVLNLSVCDITLVIVSIPTTLVVKRLGYFPYSTAACKIIYPLATYLLNCTVLTLLLISLERFTTIVYQIKYGKTDKIKAIILIHVISLITVLPYAITAVVIKSKKLYNCTESWNSTSSKAYTVALFFIQCGVPLPLMSVLYAISWKEIEKHNSKTISIVNDVNKRFRIGNNGEQVMCNTKELNRSYSYRKKQNYKSNEFHTDIVLSRRKQTRQTLLMFICIVMVFAICILPNQITWFYKTFKPIQLNNTVMHLFDWLTYANSVLNPWIYAGLNSHFRKAYTYILTKMICYPNKTKSSIRKQLLYESKMPAYILQERITKL